MGHWHRVQMLLLAGCLLVTGCGGSAVFSAKQEQKPVAAAPANTEVIESGMPVGQFDLKNGVVKLNSGCTMPIIGLGTWTLTGKTCEDAVYEAIKCGDRLIDTALYYNNQEAVGKGVRRAIRDGLATRQQLFVTTKITPYGFGDYGKTIRECNEALGLDYIDLLLIHQRGSDEQQLYTAMEKAVEQGLVRSIGISNYYTPREFDEMTKGRKILPAVIQNERHLSFQDTELRDYVKQYGTVMEAWYPLGGRDHVRENLQNPEILRLAKVHGKSPAQIILRWHLQTGFITIAGTDNPAYIKENHDILDFTLTPADLAAIAQLDRGMRYENW